MKYYIFKVKNSIGQTYYIVNNCYLGYVGIECGEKVWLRSLLEHNAKITRQYKLFAKGNVNNHSELHKIFCDNERFDKGRAIKLQKKFKLKLSKNKDWYKVVFPDPNCSASKLEKVNKKKIKQKIIDKLYFNE